MSISNPFTHPSIVNDHSLETTVVETALDEFHPKMKNIKSWCLYYWYLDEGYKRINEYLARVKSNSDIKKYYNNISNFYFMFKSKIIHNDEKLAQIIKIIKKEMKPFGDKDTTVYWRGDLNMGTQNLRSETFIAITSVQNIAMIFTNDPKKIYRVIVSPDVKCIDIDNYMKNKKIKMGLESEILLSEILLEDDCYLEIIDSKTVKIHSPRSKTVSYPYRHIIQKISNIFTKTTLYRTHRIIKYYCRFYFETQLNNYMYLIVFEKSKFNESFYNNFTYKNFIQWLFNQALTNNEIEFSEEYEYDEFNEMTKDIFREERDKASEEFETKYLSRYKSLISSKPR
jgi:hypothetical protein